MNFEALKSRFMGILRSSGEKSQYYSCRQMEQIEGSMLKTMEQLWPHIKNAEYSLIVSDDQSGRIPSLVWRTVIDRVHEQKGIDPIVFASVEMKRNDVFSLGLINELQKRALEAEAKRPGTRALISTEYMRLGYRIRDIAGFLNAVNVPYDVVSLSTEKDPNAYKTVLGEDARLFTGNIDVGSPIADLRPWEFQSARRDVPVMATLLLGHAQLFLPR